MRQWQIFVIFITFFLSVGASAQNVKLAILSELPDDDIDSPKYLKDILPACKLALEEMKVRLAKAGVHVDLDYQPFKYGPISPFETLKKIVSETNDIGAVGFQTSDEVMKAATATAGTDFIAVSPYASASSVLKLVPNYLSLATPSVEQAKLIEHFVFNNLHAKRPMAIVAWDSAFSKDFYETFSADFKKKVILNKVWDSLSGFDDLVAGIRNVNPDVVVLPNFPVNVASVIKILSKAGLHPVFVGPDSWGENSDQRFEKIVAGMNFTGYTFRQFSIHRRSPEIDRFAKRLQDHGATYSVVAGLYHDATLYMLNLIAVSPKPVTRAGVFQTANNNRFVSGVMGANCISNLSCKGRKYIVLKVSAKGFRFHRFLSVPK